MLCAQKHQAVNRTQEELSDLGSVKASQVCVCRAQDRKSGAEQTAKSML